MFVDRLLASWIGRYLSQRWHLWQQLHLIQPHPISTHIQRQLNKQLPQFPILGITILWGFVVFLMMVSLFTSLNVIVLTLLPLFLLIFSGSYILPWLYRIAKVIKQQYRNSVIDTIGVVPPGRVYVTFSICHAVLNEGDRLGWLQLLRRILVGIIAIAFLMASAIAVTQIPTMTLSGLLQLFFDIAVLSLLLYVEHQQSILIGCYIAIIVPRFSAHSGNLISNTLLNYVGLQVLTALIPLILIGGLVSAGVALSIFSTNFILFLLIREILIFVLWRTARPLE